MPRLHVNVDSGDAIGERNEDGHDVVRTMFAVFLMSRQSSLFEPCDPRVPLASRRRLSRQCEAIVNILTQRDATNDELSRMARKYTSRISDCRKAGYDIRPVSHDFKTGRVVYRLVTR